MTCDYIELANSGVQQLKPYEPGKPIEELERELGQARVVLADLGHVRLSAAVPGPPRRLAAGDDER